VVAFSVEKAYRDADVFYGLPLVDFESLGESYPSDVFECYVAISSTQLNRVRARLFNEVKAKGYQCANYVSSRSSVWHNVELGENVFIFENNTVQPFCKIGDNTVLWSGNHIGHRSELGKHCFISSHVVVSGFCTIGDYSFIGVNTTIGDNITIAEDNFIAMGALITKNTQPDAIYEGQPAQPRKIAAKRFCKVKENRG
jgi:sugar O-acyltransferase (sialic acid O-acetyltransferase NeuD family)